MIGAGEGFGAVLKLSGEETGGAYTVVEHLLEPDFGRIVELAGRYELTFHPEEMREILTRRGMELR